MDISKKKSFPVDLIEFVKPLVYDSNNILLMGSSSLESQQYFSDYDLVTNINYKQSKKNIADKIINIIEKTKHNKDMYFIELKIQNKNNKVKLQKNITVEEIINNITNLEFIKLDFVIRINNMFKELSIIYNFDKEYTNYTSQISEDIEELKKEDNYYKILKRLFSIYNYKYTNEIINSKDKENYIMLSKFFNSKWGKLYQETSNLQAIQLLLEYYKDNETLKKVIINLKDLHIEPDINIIDDLVKQNTIKINNEAKKKLKEI